MKTTTGALLATGALAGLAVLLRFLDADLVAMRTLPAVAVLFVGLHFSRNASWWMRLGYAGYLVWAAAWFVERVVERARDNISSMPEWDFLGFWLHARTATLGLNFYDPANAQSLALPFHVSQEFQREIVDVGFWYPPPSMFVFWPLGLTDDPRTALPLWYAFHTVVIVVVVLLLWRTFFAKGGVLEWLACAALVCMSHGTYQTFYYSQTNFVALLAVLLFWNRIHSLAGGAWVSVAMFAKPLLAILALGPFLARRWRVIVGLVATTVALLLVSIAAFGFDTAMDYFARDHVSAKPDWIYSQPTNQSLLGLVLRVTKTHCSGLGCVANPVYLGLAALLGGVTLIVGVGLQRAREDHWALSLFMLLGLILYPVSQLFYSVLLIPPTLLVWQRRERIAGGVWTVALLLGLVQALAALNAGRDSVLAYLLMWLIVVILGARLAQGRGWPLRTVPEPAGAADAGRV